MFVLWKEDVEEVVEVVEAVEGEGVVALEQQKTTFYIAQSSYHMGRGQ